MKTPEEIIGYEPDINGFTLIGYAGAVRAGQWILLSQEEYKDLPEIGVNGASKSLLFPVYANVDYTPEYKIKPRLTDEQIDAMFPYDNKSSLHRRIIFNDKQDWKRKGAKQVRDLLQGKGGEGV